MIMAPPRHGKTELASRRFPAKFLGKRPDKTVISTSYGSTLAEEFGRDVRNIVDQPEYKVLFPNVRLSADSQAKDRWHVAGGGGYIAAGVGTAITGRGADLLIIDDPVKGRVEAERESERKEIWEWYRGTAYQRLQPDASIVVIMTRWHEDDLVGRLNALEQEGGGDKWIRVTLPAIGDDGGALWPEAYPLDVLAQIRATSGEYNWASEYEQEPRPPGGSFFSEDDLLVARKLPDGKIAHYPVDFLFEAPVSGVPKPDYVFAVIDSAMKTGKEHDGLAVTYFAVARHGQLPYEVYVLDWDYKQVEGGFLMKWLPTVFDQLERFAKGTKALYGSVGALIEDKVSGTILIQQARNLKNSTYPNGMPAHAIDSELTAMGKQDRAINIDRYVKAGRVKLTQRAYDRRVQYKGATKNHWLSQVLSFRAGTADNAADDLLDTFTYGVALALGNKLGY